MLRAGLTEFEYETTQSLPEDFDIVASGQRAIERDPRNVSARRSLAILDEIEPANPEEALRLCQEIQQIAPQTPGNDDCIRRNQTRVNAIRAGRR